MTRLIVHADDLGLSEQVNDGIVATHRTGCLTSTSLMANGPAFAHAVAAARATPSLDLGIHLTLVEERPLAPPETIPTLVGPDGRFHRHATVFARLYALGRIDPEDVRRELEMQIRRILEQRLPISHLDGHQHLHVLPGIFAVVARLARAHSIPALRYPRERIRPYMLRSAAALARVPQMWVLGALARRARRRFPEFLGTDAFAGFVYGGRLDLARLTVVLENLPRSGTCELMCHPGLDDPATRYPHWGYRWADELRALTAPATRKHLADAGVRLISYRDLPGTGS